jgi:hypothetical protein
LADAIPVKVAKLLKVAIPPPAAIVTAKTGDKKPTAIEKTKVLPVLA